METEVTKESFIATELKKYNITDKYIAEMSKHAMALKVKDVNDNAGCKVVHQARMQVKNKRIEVEDTRKELKAESLRFGRALDNEARRITALLRPIEEHLAGQEGIVEDEKIRIKVEKAQKEKERLEKEEAERRRVWEEGQDRIKAEQEKEAARLEKIRKENEEYQAKVLKEHEEREAAIKKAHEKKEAEFRKIKEDADRAIQKEKDRIKEEQEKIEAEKREFEEQKKREEEERLQKIEDERQKKLLEEQAKIRAEEEIKRKEEERRVAEQRAKEKEELRLLLLPDKEKLFAFSDLIISLDAPIVKHASAQDILDEALEYLNKAATTLRKE